MSGEDRFVARMGCVLGLGDRCGEWCRAALRSHGLAIVDDWGRLYS